MSGKFAAALVWAMLAVGAAWPVLAQSPFGRTDLERATEIVNSGRLERYDEAVVALERWLDANPKDIAALRTLARGQAGLGRAGEADAAAARMHLISGDSKQALIFARRAQKALPEGSRGRQRAEEILNSLSAEAQEAKK